ncbi:MAG: sigma-54-dependent transcriptional regulator [Deltaproteobacteria bacterium]
MPPDSKAILIVDDERSAREFCKEILKGQGFHIDLADSGERALEILENREADIVLTDVRMPGMDGMDLLKEIKGKYPGTDVVVMTGFGSIESAVKATKLGAYDYITKPFKVEDFRRVFRRLADVRELTAENKLLKEQLRTQEGFANMVGSSPRIQKIYLLVSKAAAKRHPVLILGESGTGKELVARAIHNQGPWRDRPFVPIDCGALAPTLIESELFGHIRGAFTGAMQSRIGLLASASGGTVFLDEIAELPVELQVKLLRALQEGEIKPIGSNERTRVEARVIAATNQDVEAAIKRGSLRKDLYFRLNVVSIKMPPLRERKSDIPTLAHYFIEKYQGEDNRVTEIAYEAMSRLMNYNWPGNVRELENCIQRALVLGTGAVIHARDLPSNVLYQVGPAPESSEVSPLGELERRAILQALRSTGGDRLRAAKLLGIGKTTIYRKLKEFDLEGKDFPEAS